VTAAVAGGAAAERLVLYFDGASRGNPGPAAWGVYSPSGLKRGGRAGHTTNNVAEWLGFLAALDAAVESGAADVEIRADSQLVLRQFEGVYRMKAPHLAPYLDQAREKARRIRRLRVVHVPREQNTKADAIANAVLDGREIPPEAPPTPSAAEPAPKAGEKRRRPRQTGLFGEG
jgi:probable phosphoglycerate mutase